MIEDIFNGGHRKISAGSHWWDSKQDKDEYKRQQQNAPPPPIGHIVHTKNAGGDPGTHLSILGVDRQLHLVAGTVWGQKQPPDMPYFHLGQYFMHEPNNPTVVWTAATPHGPWQQFDHTGM